MNYFVLNRITVPLMIKIDKIERVIMPAIVFQAFGLILGILSIAAQAFAYNHDKSYQRNLDLDLNELTEDTELYDIIERKGKLEEISLILTGMSIVLSIIHIGIAVIQKSVGSKALGYIIANGLTGVFSFVAGILVFSSAVRYDMNYVLATQDSVYEIDGKARYSCYSLSSSLDNYTCNEECQKYLDDNYICQYLAVKCVAGGILLIYFLISGTAIFLVIVFRKSNEDEIIESIHHHHGHAHQHRPHQHGDNNKDSNENMESIEDDTVTGSEAAQSIVVDDDDSGVVSIDNSGTISATSQDME